MTARQRLRRLIAQEARFVRNVMIAYRREFGGYERLETAITTEVVERLRRRGHGLLHIDFSRNESKLGGDIELWLRGGGFFLGLRLQAKSLHPRSKNDGIYAYLHHVIGPRGTNPRNQVDVLIKATAPPLTPMYLYYNGLEKKPSVRSGCGRMNGFAKKNGRLGLTVTSAEFVQHWWPYGASARQLSHVLPRSVPLQCLAACDCPLSNVPVGALPLRALEWPLTTALAQPWLVLDPEFDGGEQRESMVAVMRERGVRVYDGSVPSYVLELARTGRLPEGADVIARAVAVIDGDLQDA